MTLGAAHKPDGRGRGSQQKLKREKWK